MSGMLTTDEQHELLRQLYERYAQDVYRFTRYLLGSRDDALDAVQEVFARAYTGLNSFEHRSSPKTWLYSIAKNCAIDMIRRRKHEVNSADKPDIRMTAVIDETSSIDTRIILEDAIARLKPTFRQVFVLRYVLGLSVKEAADVLSWTESKVKTTLHRATTQVRSCLVSGQSEGGEASHAGQ